MYRNDTENFKIAEIGGELRAVFQLASPRVLDTGSNRVLVRECSFNQRALGEYIVENINKGVDPVELLLALQALDRANNARIRQAAPIAHFLLHTLFGFTLTEGTVFVNDKVVAENKAARQKPAPSPAPQ